MSTYFSKENSKQKSRFKWNGFFNERL